MRINKTVERTYIANEHEFYCDKCGKYLGTSTEYEDGYYEEIGEFNLQLHVSNWYGLHKHFCDDCRKEFVNNLIKVLTDMGFEK